MIRRQRDAGAAIPGWGSATTEADQRRMVGLEPVAHPAPADMASDALRRGALDGAPAYLTTYAAGIANERERVAADLGAFLRDLCLGVDGTRARLDAYIRGMAS